MVVFHIGLPKTGTTFLQRNVFSGAPGVLFVHRSQGMEAEAFCMGLRRYVRADPVSAVWLRHRLRGTLGRYCVKARSNGQVLVVSAENISVHSVLFWQGKDPAPEQVARRLAELAGSDTGELRILIGLRDQAPWLASRYAESGKDFREFCQADFDRRLREIAALPALAGPLAWLDFGHVHEAFAARFGDANLHLYFQERLDAKPGWTLERIGAFVGGKEMGPVFRNLGRQSRGDRRNVSRKGENIWKLKSGPRARLVLRDDLKDAIMARFSESNRALRRKIKKKHLDTDRVSGDLSEPSIAAERGFQC